MLNKIIRNFIAKRVAGRSDDGIMINLTDPKKVDFQAAMLEDLLMRNGVDPRAITSEQQLKNIVNQIEAASKQTTSGIRNAESAKVFDLKGRRIKDTDNIMGGEEMPPPGSRGGPDDIAAPVMNVEDAPEGFIDFVRKTDPKAADKLQKAEDDIRAKIEAGNKRYLDKIKKQKEEGTYKRYNPPKGSKLDLEIKEEYQKAIKGESKLMKGKFKGTEEDFRNKIDEMTDDFASGGRVGLKGGADAATESFSKSAGSSRPGRKGSVSISPSGNVTFNPGGRDDPVDDRSTFEQTVNQMRRPVKQPSGLERLFDAGQEFNYLRNLAIGNFPGIAKQLLLDYGKRKLLDDQAMLDTEEDTMMLADLTDMQKKMLEGPQKNLKDIMGISNEEILQNIEKFNDPDAPATIQDIEQFYQQARDGGRIGFFMGSPLPKGLATLRTMLNFMGKKSDKVKNPSDVLKMVNPKSLNAMLEDPRLQGKVNVKEGILASDMVKDFQSKMGEDRVQLVKDMLNAAKNIKKADTSQIRLKNEMIEDMIKKGVDRRMAEEMATTMSRLAEDMAGKFKDTPKLTDEGILELENVLKNMETGGKKKRDLNADGGRIGLKDGMNRRTFLKLLGGLAAIPIVGKIIKPLKTVKGVKNVPIIKTDNVPGKPEWFDQLVNKVIIEGDDVTKKLATVEREIVHTKKINNTDEVTVYQDLNTDSVRVEYRSPDNMMEEPVDLSYKKTLPDEGNPKGDVDFEATEMGYVGRADGPDDYFIDAEEVGGRSIKDLDSDVSALKEYATGQKPTMKEIVQKKKRKDKVKKLNEGDLDAQSDYITARQGDAYDYDDYARGGIARMLGE